MFPRLLPFAVLLTSTLSIVDASPAPRIEDRDLEVRDAWIDQVLALHNENRAMYGARPLTWSAALYPDTLKWAQQCKFMHSNTGGRYGENLAIGTRPSYTIANAMDAWMAEASNYDYNNPTPLAGGAITGHFTQIVWKNTTQVACAQASCAIFATPTALIVCRYRPPGNVLGQFQFNVGKHA